MTVTVRTGSSRRDESRPAPGTRRIEELLTGHAICIRAGNTLDELAETLEANAISGVPVIDDLDRVVGVISRTDLVRYCRANDTEGELFPDGVTVGEVMCPEPVTANNDELVGIVARRMVDESVHRVVVVDQDGLVLGVVSSLDLLTEIPRAQGAEAMKFIRLNTNEGEIRWINLARVTRATYAHDSNGLALLVVLFDGGATETLRLHGDNPLDAAAIELLTAKLDSLSEAEEHILTQ